MRFGKYRGTSLEEIALGKKPAGGGGKSEGYYYFHQLANGDEQYFGMFQRDARAMNRWHEIHTKLNQFKSVYPCAVCQKNAPTVISAAGDSRYGYSVSPAYIACDSEKCQNDLEGRPSGPVSLYPLGFDTVLLFGWSCGGTKSDEKHIMDLMLQLAGWKGRLSPEAATEFIDRLTLR